VITTLRAAAAEIRRAIAASGAGAILAAYFTPVLADIASSVRTDAVAWLEGFPGRHRRAEVPFRLAPAQWLPAPVPCAPGRAEVTAWDLPPVFDRGRPYLDYYPRRAA